MVNIIVPAYNSQKYIGRCIQSLIRQTYQDLNIIIVLDNTTTDNTKSIILKYVQKDGRIKLICKDKCGPFEKRKYGVSICPDNSYVMFVDSDDVVPKNSISIMVNMLEMYDSDCVCGAYKKIWRKMVLNYKNRIPVFSGQLPRVYTKEEMFNELYVSFFGLSNYPVAFWGKLYKAELIKQILAYENIVSLLGDDLYINCRLMPNIERLLIIPNTVYYYRVWRGSTTKKFKEENFFERINLIRFRFKLIEEYKLDESFKRYLSIELYNCLVGHMNGLYNQVDLEKFEFKFKEIFDLQLVNDTLKYLKENNYISNSLFDAIYKNDIGTIINCLNATKKKISIRGLLKKIIFQLG